MTLATLAVVGANARPIGEQLARAGGFVVAVDADEFMELMAVAAFPTQYLVLAQNEDADTNRARIGIAHSLGVRVILVPRDGVDQYETGAEFVVESAAWSSLDDLLHAIDLDRRHQRTIRRATHRTTVLTAREVEASELFERVGSVRQVADQLGVSYNTAATFLKRATRKLRQRSGAM